MTQQYTDSKIEALIMSSPEPLSASRISQVMDDVTPSVVTKAVAQLNQNYADAGSSFRIRELAGGFQFYLLSEYMGLIEELFSRQRKLRLSRAALETVAIIAYRQPVTKTDIEHIRGVASDGVIRTLLEKNLVSVTGRSEGVGRALQYGTTDEFLKFFGLARIDDLPSMSEIEEMIATREPKSQTEISFELGVDNQSEKLNIADGTFDPKRREALEDGMNPDQSPAPESESLIPSMSVGPVTAGSSPAAVEPGVEVAKSAVSDEENRSDESN